MHDPRVMDAVRSNTDLLNNLLAQITDVRHLVDASRSGSQKPDAAKGEGLGLQVNDSEVEVEARNLRKKIQRLESENAALHAQNKELAAKVVTSRIQEKAPENSVEAGEMLSWEERKRQILLQMEEDSFDANQFVASLNREIESGKETPEAFIDRLRLEIEHRDQEIAELHNLLDRQSETRSDGTAIGTSAIAEILDADELIAHERGKLQQLQAEWEEKFREGEIEASLERAKLSREWQEVSATKRELELQFEQVQREYRQTKAAGSSGSRRWLAKLGLADEDF